jgi:rRNA-processing protein EBP2
MSESSLWLETLDLYGPTHVEGLVPGQAVELEKKMYEAALSSAKEGYRRLSDLKVTASRRTDYLAEMLKDDKQMTKIRSRLVTAQQRIEVVESRKKKQAQKKFAKQMKAAKIEKRKEQKLEERLAKPSTKDFGKDDALAGDAKAAKDARKAKFGKSAKKGNFKKGGGKGAKGGKPKFGGNPKFGGSKQSKISAGKGGKRQAMAGRRRK